jgi:hypothetical protein
MKTKHLLLLLALFSVPFLGNAQPFASGDKAINLGLGLGSVGYRGAGYKTSLPPVSVSFEYGIMEAGPGVIGVGGYLGISAYKWDYGVTGYDLGWKYTNFLLGARGSYHYSFVDKLDTYAGLMLGYRIVSAKETGTWPATWPAGVDLSAKGSSFLWSTYVGARYYFANSFAAMMELGYGVSWINIGMAFKF